MGSIETKIQVAKPDGQSVYVAWMLVNGVCSNGL